LPESDDFLVGEGPFALANLRPLHPSERRSLDDFAVDCPVKELRYGRNNVMLGSRLLCCIKCVEDLVEVPATDRRERPLTPPRKEVPLESSPRLSPRSRLSRFRVPLDKVPGDGLKVVRAPFGFGSLLGFSMRCRIDPA
jgi:hypothetical protein